MSPPLPSRPTPADIRAARDMTIDDVLAPALRVLFCGINPGLYSGATGWHFARPGNRFWAALYGSGFTDRLLHPSEQRDLLAYGLGITNLVRRTTARADELSDDELRSGGARVQTLAATYRPAWVAIVGVTAFRTAFSLLGGDVGPQDLVLADARVWVLPNPSGLNAHYQLPRQIEAFAALRAAALAPAPATI